MDKKQAYEQTERHVLPKIMLLLGIIIAFVGCITAVCSFDKFEPLLFVTCGLSTALLGLSMIGFSYIVKAAILYLNINEQEQNK